MADYQVLSQRQTETLTADGRFVPVMEVTFKVLPSGVVGKVDVPVENYTADHVREVIADYAARIAEVHALGQS